MKRLRYLLALSLVLAVAAPVWAQQPTPGDPTTEMTRDPRRFPPRRPPVILVNEGAGSEPIHVREVSADVRIDGFLAETTLTMTFHNPNPRILEGELVFPLPEGSTLSGYGLDVDGQVVDGVVVEREAARVAFETEVRGNIDPGLAEWVQGSVFRTRIYPLPANGGRTVKISYVSDLTVAGNAASYLLPMAYNEPLSQLTLRVAVARGAAEPSIASGGLGAITFASWETQWVAETTLTDVSPTEDLIVAVPLPDHTVLVEETEDGDRYFAVLHHLPTTEGTGAADPIAHAVVLFDASASREAADLDRELALIETWGNAHPSIELHLVVLRDVLSPAVAIAEGPDRGTRLAERLRAEPLDGGTDLSFLTFPTDLRQMAVGADPALPVDAYLLFSDGLGSLGEPERVDAAARVYAVSSSSEANHAWLRDVSERTGGVAVNLQRQTDESALASLEEAPFRLASIAYEPGTVEAIEVPSLVVRDGQTILTGRLLADSTTLTLSYGTAGSTATTSTVAISAVGTAQPGVVSKYWAQLRLSGLALASERNRVELLRLGREFNLVTPQTSYLVLETLDQHLRYGIPPAATRPEMLEQFNAQIEARTVAARETREQKLARVAGWWAERIAWYERTAEAGPGAPPPTTGVPTTGVPSTAPVDEPLVENNLDEGFEIWESRQDLETLAAEPVPSPEEAGGLPMRSSMGERESAPDSPMGGSMGLGGAGGDFGAAESEVSASVGGPGPGDDSNEDDRTRGTIAVQAWSPDTPYLRAITAVDPEQAYATYLTQREGYRRSPAFYLDVASLLYEKGRDAEAHRVLTNIAELGLADARLMRIVAYKLQEEGDLDLAIRLFEEVQALRPDEPQSSRDLALALATRADRLADSGERADAAAPMADWARAVELLSTMVGSNTDRFEQIEMPSLHEANRIIARMERYAEAELGGLEAMPSLPLDPRLRRNLDLDVRVLLRWDTDMTDMDLWVNEPSGERAWYQNHTTAAGGLFGRDYTGGYGPEEYVLRTAPSGTFEVNANFYGSREQSLTGGTTLQVDIFTNYGRPTERRQTATVRLTSSGETVLIGHVTLDDSGNPTFDLDDRVQVSAE